jgi:hypothetical protein
MFQKNTLNILNGQEMYDYYKHTQFLEEEWMIPFNEAMCYGDTTNHIFSQEFVEIRSKVHHVTPSQYTEITLKPLAPLIYKDFIHIALWYDEDMFCQINLLTILGWLDYTHYKGTIDLYIVDNMFKPLENFSLQASGYFELYTQVLIHKTLPKTIHPLPLKKGIELYLNYLHKDSELMQYIERHKEIPESELLRKLLETFMHYGLGDLQYLDLIKNNRK